MIARQYALSICCNRGNTFHHEAWFVEAGSPDEARGMGYRIARRVYPQADGFAGHDVSVTSVDGPLRSADIERIRPIGQPEAAR